MPLPHTLAALALTGLLTGCSLPPPEQGTASSAASAQATADSPLGQSAAALRGAQPAHLSGIHSLGDAQQAFGARKLLARAATHTLDVQYYIWRNDKTGQLLLRELLLAADRGVRVRLLLDDHGTSGLDDVLAALHQHPHIEVRLFNPFAVRAAKWLGFVTEFRRANRRMHNKSFTADNQATIIGGRNVGNEYFGATDGVLFADLDVLAIGPAVQAVSSDFDRYWNSPSAYPVAQLVGQGAGHTLDTLRAQYQQLHDSEAASDFRRAVANHPLVAELLSPQLPLEWAQVHLVSDDPAKIFREAPEAGLMLPQLLAITGAPTRQLDIISPYFVPTQSGVDAFVQLQQSSVQVRVLTNALEATDVALVHSGYAKYRKPLLQAGVQLLEMRSQTPEKVKLSDQFRQGLHGSSGSSLHAKTITFDGRKVFIGSFNFDPRSAALNTELGFVIDSPQLAAQIDAAFRTEVPQRAFTVFLESGALRWKAPTADGSVIYAQEPYSSWWLRWALHLASWLPIEGML